MATFISLNQYDLVEVAGVDAEKYLQGQLTCDVVHWQQALQRLQRIVILKAK